MIRGVHEMSHSSEPVELRAFLRPRASGVSARSAGLVMSIAAATLACAQGPDHEALRRELVELHEASIQAHLDADPDFFARDLSEDYVVVSGAEIIRPDAELVREQFEAYLSSTTFDRYETTDGPFVDVSDDGSVGWIITRVAVDATSLDASGNPTPMTFDSAWLSLYRRRGGDWIFVANVSNVVPR